MIFDIQLSFLSLDFTQNHTIFFVPVVALEIKGSKDTDSYMPMGNLVFQTACTLILDWNSVHFNQKLIHELVVVVL